jgi:hypothetical protein
MMEKAAPVSGAAFLMVIDDTADRHRNVDLAYNGIPV